MRRVSVSLLGVALLGACAEVTPEPLGLEPTAAPLALTAEATFYSDIPYGPDERQVFDLFVPPGEGPFPVVLQVHGGGFTGGDEDALYEDAGGAELVDAVLAAGAALANVEYRVLDDVDTDGVIKSLHDTRTALQFLRWHQDELKLDGDRVVGRGLSAGAGTVMWLAAHDDMADPEAEDPVLWQSSRLSAALCLETQATYDLVRWETDVFEEYGITLEIAVEFGLEQTLLSFYGVSSVDAIYEEPTVSYRADVDMMAQFGPDDPPMWFENVLENDGYPLTVGALYHHPNHATFAADAAEAGGVAEVIRVVPKVDQDTSGGESNLDFVLRNL